MKLLRFGSKSCAHCRSMDRNRVVERFWFKYPELQVEKISLEPEGDPNTEKYALRYLPVVVFVDDLGRELNRSTPVDTMSVATLEILYETAKRRAEITK